MKIHPRTLVVQKADLEFQEAFIKLQQKHNLSPAEASFILSERLKSEAAWMVREERERDSRPG